MKLFLRTFFIFLGLEKTRKVSGPVLFKENFSLLVANNPELRRRGAIEQEQPIAALKALRQAILHKRIIARRMRAINAGRRLLAHVRKRRIVEAVRTKRIVSILGHGVDQQLEVVQRTLQLTIQLDLAVLRQVVSVLARFAVQSLRLALHQLHVASTLATPTHRLAHGRQGRKRVLEQRVHEENVLHEKVKLVLEYFESMRQNVGVVGLAERDQIELLLHLGPHFGQAQVRVDALIAVHEHHAQSRGHEASIALELHVVSLAYVVYVHGYRGVRADAVFLHETYQLALGEIVGWRGLLLEHFDLCFCVKTRFGF